MNILFPAYAPLLPETSAPCPAGDQEGRPLAPTLSERERKMLIGAVRLTEAIRLGLDPRSFDPAEP